MKPGINVGNEGDWSTKPESTLIFPGRITKLLPEEREFIEKALRHVGIDQNTIDSIFSSPHLPDVCKTNRGVALAVYAAIKEATKGRYHLTRTFRQWSREVGLPW
jgi:hypothetical protein